MSSTYFHAEDVSDIHQIEKITFSIYTNEDVKKYSVIKDPYGLTNPNIKDRNVAVVGGPADPRLGAVDKEICKTCFGDEKHCQGHFGHVELVEPLYNYFLLNHGIKNILPFYCLKCYRPLANEKQKRKLRNIKNPRLRFAKARKIAKSVTNCLACAVPAHNIRIKKDTYKMLVLAVLKTKIAVKDKDVNHKSVKTKKKIEPRVLTPQKSLEICSGIKELDLMGLKMKPTNLIQTHIPIPPMQIRPSSYYDQNQTPSNDSITHDLSAVIRFVNGMRKVKSGDGDLRRTHYSSLNQYYLQVKWANYFATDSTANKSQQKTSSQGKNISERLRGKNGRIRNNVIAKRVDYSGRSVITGNGAIALNQVVIPLMIAKILTKSEIVNEKNIDRLRAALINGPYVWPGANSIVIREYVNGVEVLESWNFHDNPKYAENKAKTLEYGHIVYRHLIDNDAIILNRQPSLHRYSMMTHKTKINHEDPTSLTIQINVNITGPYGADFDGDEMNIFDIQGTLADVEARLIMDVSNHFISIAKSNVIITAVHHTISGLYMMSMNEIKIDWVVVQDMLAATSISNKVYVPKGKVYTGKEAFSLILPSGINIKKGDLEIKNSVLTSGFVTKDIISLIIENCNYIHGKEATLVLFSDLQKYTMEFLARYSPTIGIDDTIFPQKIMRQAYQLTETKLRKIMGDINKYENDPLLYSSDVHEEELLAKLKIVKVPAEKLLIKNLNQTSGLAILINSKASGDSANLQQISEKLGQTILAQKRIPLKYNNRSLPGFAQYDPIPEGRGYCKQSFLSGLSVEQFYFHLMTGREGTIHTNIKTSETGYIQRRLVKMMEGLTADYIGCVRHENGKIIQHVYGDIGVNPSKQQKYKFFTAKLSDLEIKKRCLYSPEEIKKNQLIGEGYTEKINEKIWAKMIKYRNNFRNAQKIYSSNIFEFKEEYFIPVDLNIFIKGLINERELYPNKKYKKSDYITAVDVVKKIKEMYSKKLVIYYTEKQKLRQIDDRASKTMIKYYLFDILGPKRCTDEYRFTYEEFDKVVFHFNEHMDISRIDPGEMVGVISSHSISEPLTQLGLKQFQKAGTGKSNASGVLRVKEIIEVKENIATPTHRIVLKDKYRLNKKLAESIAGYLTYTKFYHIIQERRLYYDPYIEHFPPTENGMEPTIMKDDGSPGTIDDIKDCPWIAIFVLQREQMILRDIQMIDLIKSFYNNWKNKLTTENKKKNKKANKKIIEPIMKCAVVTNYDTDDEPIFHIRFNSMDSDDTSLIEFGEIIKRDYTIKGVKGIKNAKAVLEKGIPKFNEDGSVTEEDRYVIYTNGVNIPEVSKIKYVDMKKSYCNHIVEVYKHYGIEVARTVYIKELISAFENVEASINYQHVELLADVVTYLGNIIPVTRHGTNKMDIDPLARITFEKIVEQASSAGIFEEVDHIRSTAALNMVGRQVKGGTGMYKLGLDLDLVKELVKNSKSKQDKLNYKNNQLESNKLKNAFKMKNKILKSMLNIKSK